MIQAIFSFLIALCPGPANAGEVVRGDMATKVTSVELQVGQYFGFETLVSNMPVIFEIHCTDSGKVPSHSLGPRSMPMTGGQKLEITDRYGSRSDVYCIKRFSERVR